MSSATSEYDDLRRAYDDAFHRWSHAEASPVAGREYHELRDRLARYILEHAAPVRRANGKAASPEPPKPVNAAVAGA